LSEVAASIHVGASLAETWEHYFDPRGWRSWVDGFHATTEARGYPEAGGTLRWRSVPAGRGEVSEQVLEHEPRRLHRTRFSDPESEGELTTRFEVEGDGTRVSQALDYRISRRGPFTWLTDLLFVRSQMHRSLERSLLRFKSEVEDLGTARAVPPQQAQPGSGPGRDRS
jgi:Polyketide cyclase / dehydrase and lipid transport